MLPENCVTTFCGCWVGHGQSRCVHAVVEPGNVTRPRRIDLARVDLVLQYLGPESGQPSLSIPAFHEYGPGSTQIEARDVMRMGVRVSWQPEKLCRSVASGNLSHRDGALTGHRCDAWRRPIGHGMRKVTRSENTLTPLDAECLVDRDSP